MDKPIMINASLKEIVNMIPGNHLLARYKAKEFIPCPAMSITSLTTEALRLNRPPVKTEGLSVSERDA